MIDMEVVCLEEEAFFVLVDEVVNRIQATQSDTEAQKWLDTEEAMKLLKIKSKTTLQKLRDEGKIRFSQPQPKWIVYDRDSLHDYLNRNAREPF